MTLYKRRLTWWVKYMVDGKMHYVSTHCHKLADAKFFANSIDTARHAPTLEDAIAILRTLYRERPRTTLPLADAWAAYERMATTVGKLNLSPKVIRDRRYRLESLIRWLSQTAATVKDVEGVTGSVALLYAQHLANEGKKTKTRKNIIMDLSTIWRILEKTSADIHNPWISLSPQDVDGERGQPFTREEETRILDAAKRVGKDWYDVCTVARWTGLRYGDIAHLLWRDVTLDASPRLQITPSKTAKHGVTVTIPLVPPVAAILAERPHDGDYVFPLHALFYDRARQDELKFREVLDAAGVEGHSFHSWRHTFRTRLAEAGVATETAMRLCGHTRIETSRRYDHDDHLAEMRQAIEATVSPPRYSPN